MTPIDKANVTKGKSYDSFHRYKLYVINDY